MHFRPLQRGGRPWSHGNPIRQSFERREAAVEAEWAASGRPIPPHAPGWLPSLALHDLLTDSATGTPYAPDSAGADELPF